MFSTQLSSIFLYLRIMSVRKNILLSLGTALPSLRLRLNVPQSAFSQSQKVSAWVVQLVPYYLIPLSNNCYGSLKLNKPVGWGCNLSGSAFVGDLESGDLGLDGSFSVTCTGILLLLAVASLVFDSNLESLCCPAWLVIEGLDCL